MNFEDLEQNVNSLPIIITTKIRKYVCEIVCHVILPHPLLINED
jgi:hypothetical protein